jgi:acetyl-CoA C-acetyltransferase
LAQLASPSPVPGVCRAQDAFAIESYARASAAIKAGLFDGELAPVTLKGRKGEASVFSVDESVGKVDLAKVPTLRPVFKPQVGRGGR